MTVELETYAFPPFEVRYLRIIGHGNAANLWNSIIEISPARVTASDFQAPNVPENVLDSDLNTRWSALRKG